MLLRVENTFWDKSLLQRAGRMRLRVVQKGKELGLKVAVNVNVNGRRAPACGMDPTHRHP